MSYLLVFLGGGLGATLRHAVNTLCARLFGTHFPFGTFLINISGSLVMGLIAGYLAFRGQAAQPWRAMRHSCRRLPSQYRIRKAGR